MVDTYCIGIDFGSDSVRAMLVNAANGDELGISVFEYSRWAQGLYCNPGKNQFRQHPLDYLEGLEFTIRTLLDKIPGCSAKVCAISIDTTGSTPVAVTEDGTPLALLPEFSDDPDAMFILWKDHTAIHEADRINSLCRSWDIDYTKYSGGSYSPEWFWAKILHVMNKNGEVAKAAFSWVEHCDWIAALLTGYTDPLGIKRSRCAAGHKALWHPDWGGLPSEQFLEALKPGLSELRDRLYTDTYTSDCPVGTLSKDWAARLGLAESVVVGVGGFDAHFGAVGGGIKPYYISKVVGTSTCDMLVVPNAEIGNKLISGICGQVDGSIVPGMLGMEAGQSAFGDIYAWFRNLLLWPIENCLKQNNKELLAKLKDDVIRELTLSAAQIPAGGGKVLSVDWFNGRRTPDANAHLKGAITGLTLGTDAPGVFRSLVESTAFGSKKIMERFKEEGIPIYGLIALGGVAKKSAFVMQTLADVLNIPIKVIRSENACALGAAMFASVVGGIYSNIGEAQEKMGSGYESEYIPIAENVEVYKQLYNKYLELGRFVELV